MELGRMVSPLNPGGGRDGGAVYDDRSLEARSGTDGSSQLIWSHPQKATKLRIGD